MPDREKVIKEWEAVLSRDPLDAPWDLIEDTLALLKEQDEIIKESERMAELFNDAVARCRKYMEKCGVIPVEQEKKQIIVHKKHVITWKRDDVFNMRNLYEAVCETLLDEGKLIIARTDDHEKVEFVFYVTESGEAHGHPERNLPDREAGGRSTWWGRFCTHRTCGGVTARGAHGGRGTGSRRKRWRG